MVPGLLKVAKFKQIPSVNLFNQGVASCNASEFVISTVYPLGARIKLLCQYCYHSNKNQLLKFDFRGIPTPRHLYVFIRCC